VGEGGKAVLMAVSEVDGLIFVLFCLFLAVMTVKPLSTALTTDFLYLRAFARHGPHRKHSFHSTVADCLPRRCLATL
jgi:hypothetical protein